MDEHAIDRVIEAAYESTLAPAGMPILLESLGRAFNSHFVDIYARTDDHVRMRGLAFGLDKRDYEEEFLGVWARRNVWGQRRPVRVPGEVVSTRQIVAPDELKRSEMYCDYLGPRGLHEGLRLAIWVGEGWIQDISLLRSWRSGPFTTAEMTAAHRLLPHLQRCAAVTRRLRQAAAFAQAGASALDALRQGIFLLAADGRVLWANRAAEALIADADALTLERGVLCPATAAAEPALRNMLARVLGGGARRRLSATLRLARASGRLPLALIALPVGAESDWSWMHPPAAVIVTSDPNTDPQPRAALLGELFNLTASESGLAADLLGGRTLAEIAIQRGRSINTVRTQLARLMAKTDTNRQSDLLRLLMSLPPTDLDCGPLAVT
jgi:DNA-binding CsgD family transcriptional regulator/PAS domain-containing protein